MKYSLRIISVLLCIVTFGQVLKNKNSSTKSSQSQPVSTPKPSAPVPRPTPSQGQPVSKGGKNK